MREQGSVKVYYGKFNKNAARGILMRKAQPQSNDDVFNMQLDRKLAGSS